GMPPLNIEQHFALVAIPARAGTVGLNAGGSYGGQREGAVELGKRRVEIVRILGHSEAVATAAVGPAAQERRLVIESVHIGRTEAQAEAAAVIRIHERRWFDCPPCPGCPAIPMDRKSRRRRFGGWQRRRRGC